MGVFGGSTTFPLELGGGDDSTVKAFKSLQALLGVGGFSIFDDGIDALRLTSIAMGLSAFIDFDERAALQFYPDHAIDNLPIYEDVLKIVTSEAQSEEDRRAAVTERWTQQWSSEIPILQSLLKNIDARFSIVDVSWEKSQTTVFGRAVRPYITTASDPHFQLDTGSKGYTDWPAYSTRDEVYVLFDLGTPGAVPDSDELRIMQRAKDFLDQVLPSPTRHYILTELGLIAGVSPVGYAGVQGS